MKDFKGNWVPGDYFRIKPEVQADWDAPHLDGAWIVREDKVNAYVAGSRLVDDRPGLFRADEIESWWVFCECGNPAELDDYLCDSCRTISDGTDSR